MRITDVHARFWSYHRGPRWIVASIARSSNGCPWVHHCINAHVRPVRVPPRGELEASNTIGLVKHHGRGGETLHDYLRYLATSPHSNMRRAAFCRRWLKRLEK